MRRVTAGRLPVRLARHPKGVCTPYPRDPAPHRNSTPGMIVMAKQEDFRGHIQGVNEMQEVISIAVYKLQGQAVRLIGPHGYSHAVHPNNVHSLEGWQQEAADIWKLDDLVYFPPSLVDLEKKLTERNQNAETAKNDDPLSRNSDLRPRR